MMLVNLNMRRTDKQHKSELPNIMIRIFIALIGLFLIWVLFFSRFRKETKVVIVALAIGFSVFGVWYENTAKQPKQNILPISSIVNCGLMGKHSYRTNYDVSVCMANMADSGTVKRVEFSIIAKECLVAEKCDEVERVRRHLAVNLLPQSNQTIEQSLAFNRLDPDLANIQWSFEVHSIEAVK